MRKASGNDAGIPSLPLIRLRIKVALLSGSFLQRAAMARTPARIAYASLAGLDATSLNTSSVISAPPWRHWLIMTRSSR